MAWTTFPTLTDGTVLTGAHMQIVKANFDETAPAKATTAGSIFAATGTNTIAQRTPDSATSATTGTTTSATYTATLTSGGTSPAVTMSTGPKAFISLHGRLTTSVAGNNVWISCAVSGASTIAADDLYAVSDETTGNPHVGIAYLEEGLTAGTNTFTLQYKADGGATGTFSIRRINVIPF